MAKVSSRPRAHKRKPSVVPLPRLNYFERANMGEWGDYPVDHVVDERLGHGPQRRQVKRLKQAVIDALGNESAKFIDLDSLLGDVQQEREETYFNVGYEHGFLEGTVSNVRKKRGIRLSKLADEIGRQARERIIQAGLSTHESICVFAESLCAAAVLSLPAESAVTP